MSKEKGGFTLPGEAGYEALTLRMAEKWGADVIRDSDGTRLSEEILNAGYGIYSTICIIRDHNEWASANPDKLQQTFLITQPRIADGTELSFRLLEDFFEEQFRINDTPGSRKYWQLYDRTENREVPEANWSYDPEKGTVTAAGLKPWHTYTFSFLAYRIWEEISMYNHITNSWDKEHLMQVDPRWPETRKYLLTWMEDWCVQHPETTVVRFTSLFYNFVWIWGSSERKRNLFTDWGAYDFTVSPPALEEFEQKYGYALTAEDFVNQGKFHVTHMPGNTRKRDWMSFINDFVIDFGKQLVEIVHAHGKKAYVFYDDSWVGMEPYNGRFREFGFDGLIKCVFSGYEARLCAGADVETHELRLHPYLFPVGLGGAPTFMEGGDPAGDALEYWIRVRRALLREPVERIGLGGYLHLTENFPEFADCIEKISDEFREIKRLHRSGTPFVLKPRIAVLHTWGKLRSWTLSGHFHETYMHDLIHINESLSGLPLKVSFISFEDVKAGALEQADVVINAGYAGSAWSGGDAWKDPEIVERLTKWVFEGGCLIGVNEPSAVLGYDTYFRMASVLGIDEDTGARVCHGKWSFGVERIPGLLKDGVRISGKANRYLTDGKAMVLAEEAGVPTLTVHSCGKGSGIYLASYEISPENTRMLLNLILYGAGESLDQFYLTDNVHTECAYFPESGELAVVNNGAEAQYCCVRTPNGKLEFRLMPYETRICRADSAAAI
ncbi:MAG: 1,3-beta-galactosyl-N-acetylhexosamine phosphorylase [Candidatus Limivivens sp.]|nr:1,3-beta-galactosyl-N-acetylhexosamine phosphorylase [Candidatus Limivivens sp.]